jgi:hypothetical protein
MGQRMEVGMWNAEKKEDGKARIRKSECGRRKEKAEGMAHRAEGIEQSA